MSSDPPLRRGVRWWDRQGMRGGLLAGIGFALVELLLMDVQEGHLAVARLLRRIAAMWIGPAALDPEYSFGAVAVVGTIMHFGFSAIFGLIFAWMTESLVRRLILPRGMLVALAAAYGLLLWPINIYLIAPFVGWEWFATETEPGVQFIAHLCYGVLLGLYLDRRLAARRSQVTWLLRPRGRTPRSAS